MTNEEQAQLAKFGSHLKNLRESKGYSQEKFAERVDLDRTYISGLERGLRNPSFLILKKLADSLEINVSELFGE